MDTCFECSRGKYWQCERDTEHPCEMNVMVISEHPKFPDDAFTDWLGRATAKDAERITGDVERERGDGWKSYWETWRD